MTVRQFLAQVKTGKRVSFADTLRVIDEHYAYRPVRFTNGPQGDQVVNEAGTNQGSCKIFAFAKRHALTEQPTLALFGEYYWRDVLPHPNGEDHANIRRFMKYGWHGIEFADEALTPRQSGSIA